VEIRLGSLSLSTLVLLLLQLQLQPTVKLQCRSARGLSGVYNAQQLSTGPDGQRREGPCLSARGVGGVTDERDSGCGNDDG
jgi:hypothetical protein